MITLLQYRAMFMDRVGPFIWLIIPLVLLDLGLKAWSMWRSARMNKPVWFVILLLVNSLGILPAIFLLMTNDAYKKMAPKQM